LPEAIGLGANNHAPLPVHGLQNRMVIGFQGSMPVEAPVSCIFGLPDAAPDESVGFE
jgi:hypothetical protein